MRKRIEVADVELGMFIHKLEGSWLNHPFWRARFVLRDPAKLRKLRDSAVEAVIIDTARGADIAPKDGPLPEVSANPKITAIRPAAGRTPQRRRTDFSRPVQSQGATAEPEFDSRSVTPQRMAREFGNANRVVGQARRVISKAFIEARLGKMIKPGLVEPVIEDIFASVQRNPHAINGLMRCKRDSEYIYRHALAVSALMISLGRQMKLPPEQLRLAGSAGLLIDVGVGHLPIDLPSIQGDYRRLDPELLRDHGRLGHDLLLGSGMPEVVARVCLEHHERVDGKGYPEGLVGMAISQFGRMAAICDHYDELVNDADGALGLDPAAAIERMSADEGCFDSAILAKFVEMIGVYPIGSVVLLRSGRLAMVVDQSASDMARPRVRAFYAAATGRMVTPVDIALDDCFGEDAIEETVSPESYGLADFPRLRERLFAEACAAA